MKLTVVESLREVVEEGEYWYLYCFLNMTPKLGLAAVDSTGKQKRAI